MTKGVKEDVVLRSCLEWLRLNGIYSWRNNSGAVKVGRRFIRFGFPGSSDIIGILPDGRFLAVECKREKGGVLSDLQKDFLSNIEKNGGIAIVARSVDELKEKLSEKRKKSLLTL